MGFKVVAVGADPVVVRPSALAVNLLWGGGRRSSGEGRRKRSEESFLLPSPGSPPFLFQRLSAGGEAVRRKSRCLRIQPRWGGCREGALSWRQYGTGGWGAVWETMGERGGLAGRGGGNPFRERVPSCFVYQCMKKMPVATRATARSLTRENFSPRKNTARSMPKMTDVSRRAATMAMGALVMAQRATP